MKKALFIVGPTSSGKTNLAFETSKIIQSVLISADSVQVYKKTDIISGKDIPHDSRFDQDHYLINSTPLYMVSIIDPTSDFSVYDFVENVEGIVEREKNKIPIIVGGTRFYINALINKIDTLSIPPDLILRESLKGKSVSILQDELGKLDPDRKSKMNLSDVNNPRRLIRAIEVAKNKNRTKKDPIFKKDEVLIVGLVCPFESIKRRIDIRLSERINKGGIDEAKELFKNYKNLSDQIKNTNGYKQLFEYFLGKLTYNDAIEKWRISEYQLAKEQLKWVKNIKDAHILDVEKTGFKEEVLSLISHEFIL